jgi:phosphoglycerate dehydrogenase-like enzyme
LAGARHLVDENVSLRAGGWQRFIGEDLGGRTLGVLGLGNIGSSVARIGKAFGMTVIAWSQNLTADRAVAVGVGLVSKDGFFGKLMSSAFTLCSAAARADSLVPRSSPS